jgi:hypothetical protein
MRREEIGYAVRKFTDWDERPVFWGYFPAYDLCRSIPAQVSARALLSAPGFSRMVGRAATAADPGTKAHAHRHVCGYKLANDGHDARAIQA